MKILVIGSGGREHALCWKLARSPLAPELFCAPGNPGTARCARNLPIPAGQLDRLVEFAREERIDLTVTGPEAPLCAGLADRFASAGLRLAGPSAAAAQLEGSKAFAKRFMQRHGIPTAEFGVFEDPAAACDYIDAHPRALVVKADGLAAGKGVVVCREPEEAKLAARGVLAGDFGAAGRRVVVEELLQGEEASFIALTDGERICPLAGSQDHKSVFEGGAGPNTGGMGAYSPTPIIDERLQARVMAEVMGPVVHGMAEEGTPFRGILYAGLMVEPDGRYRVLEFNCRLGDPETQPLMMRLRSDLVPYLLGVAEGRLPAEPPSWDPRAALCVVLASGGYPGTFVSGLPIQGLAEAEALADVAIFHAGTAMKGEQVVTAGGRVLGVTALGEDVAQARARVYQAAALVRWQGLHFRRDIGQRAAAR